MGRPRRGRGSHGSVGDRAKKHDRFHQHLSKHSEDKFMADTEYAMAGKLVNFTTKLPVIKTRKSAGTAGKSSCLQGLLDAG